MHPLNLLKRNVEKQKNLHRNRCSLIIPLFIVGLIILQLITPFSFAGGPPTYQVDKNGGADFTTIQAAIDAAQDGYFINIHEGVYNEHIIINKAITVQGENKDLVIIDGGGVGFGVTVNHNDVTVQTLTIRHAGHGINISASYVSVANLIIDNTGKGIVLTQATYTSISGCTINNSQFGCWIKQSSHNTTIIQNSFSNSSTAILISDSDDQRITQNSIRDCPTGISLFTSRNIVRSNTINTTDWGMVLYGSSFNTVQSNTFLHQGIILLGSDIFSGLPVYYTSHTIEDNTLDGSPIYYYSQQQDIEVPTNAAQVILADCQNMLIRDHEYSGINDAIQIAFSSDCTIANTHIENSSIDGISIGYSSRIHIIGSTIKKCAYGLMMSLNSDITIIHNNFVDNTHAVYIDQGGIWDDGYPFGGNYWSNYTGSDANHDGIGDTPYAIMGGAQDRYPFMQPSGWKTFAVNVTAPDQVNESISFDISVLVQDVPLPNATVSFAGRQYMTSAQGSCTVTAPSVSSNHTYELSVEKFGYPSKSISILVRDTGSLPGQYDQLTLVAPDSVIEGNQFLVTVISNQQPVSNVQISFDSRMVYTSADGTATLQAPDVEDDTVFTIQAVKSEYLPDETTIIVRIQNSSITLRSPNGGDSLHDAIKVAWTVSSTEALDHHIISLYYRYHTGLWMTIAEDISVLSSSYSWDTTMLPDGYPYQVKAVLKEDIDNDGIYETIVSEDISDAPFAVDNTLLHQGWVHGIVYEKIDDATIPIVNATVYVILSDVNNIITSKCTFTNESGEYIIPVQAGVYTMIAGKTGYNETILTNVSIWVNQTTELNISLSRGAASINLFILNENRDEINKAIRDQQVGGEISIIKGAGLNPYEKQVFIYDSVTISPEDVTTNQVSLLVSGNEKTTGKTIVINLDKNVFDLSKSLDFKYDGEPLQMADDLADVLDPNNDGLHAEYLLTKGANGMQIIISIPHFSEHEITISSVVEAIGSITAFAIYIVIFLILGIVYIAPFFLVRKSK